MVNKVQNPSSVLPGLKNRDDLKTEKNGNFEGTLKNLLTEVDELQKEAGESAEAFVSGELTDLHQVTVSAQKARIGLELLLEIRNKMVESYQEIMRMQV